MPNKPKSPCRFPGCPELTHERYCKKHNRQVQKNYNRYSRSPETSKRYGKRWRKLRAIYIKAHPICELCRDMGFTTPTQEVHHIIPLSQGGTHSDKNLMSLCKKCHSYITAKEGGRWGQIYFRFSVALDGKKFNSVHVIPLCTNDLKARNNADVF